MDAKITIAVTDPQATEALFGNPEIATHLYHILYGTLKEDHIQLVKECDAQQYETARSLIHRIKGALKYCRVPEYEYYLLALEEDMAQSQPIETALEDLQEACLRLYVVLDEMFAESYGAV